MLDVPVDIRERIYGDMRRATVLDRFALPDGITTLPEAIPFTIQEAVSEEGDPLPPEEAARNLAARLEQVRSVPTEGGRDPLGVRVTVDLEMEGLRGENLLLYWRLLPAGGTTPVPDVFAQATPAFRLTPGSELDSATLDVWVPLPEAPGPYAVDLLVMHEAPSAPLESFRSEPFD